MEYPKECPVVEWIDDCDDTFPRGEIFEIVELYETRDYGGGFQYYRCFLRTRTGKTRPLHGLWSLGMKQIRPLTPAAIEMLAAVKAEAKTL